MSITIAIAGKGGSGKTTIAALLIKFLVQSQKTPVLAIDADPSVNLNCVLGIPLKKTIGEIREELSEKIQEEVQTTETLKQDYFELKMYEAITESSGVDLLAMGRPEGPGCYCAVNNMLRLAIDRLARGYRYVVIDCEAGMEHISRQTTRDVDIIIIVSDPTIRGITAAARMKELIGEIRSRVGKICFVINRVEGELPEQLKNTIANYGLELTATLPEEPQIANLEINGTPIVNLPLDSPLSRGIEQLAYKINI